MNTMSDNFFVVQNSVPHTETDDTSSSSGSHAQPDSQSLLPRSGWQNQRAFLSVLIKAKQSLDIAEITALLDLK